MDEYGPINRRIVNIGVGGTIETPPSLIDAEPRSIVTIRANFKLGATKHKFNDDGSVNESTILTLDPSTFHVVEVAAAPEPAEQATLGEDDD